MGSCLSFCPTRGPMSILHERAARRDIAKSLPILEKQEERIALSVEKARERVLQIRDSAVENARLKNHAEAELDFRNFLTARKTLAKLEAKKDRATLAVSSAAGQAGHVEQNFALRSLVRAQEHINYATGGSTGMQKTLDEYQSVLEQQQDLDLALDDLNNDMDNYGGNGGGDLDEIEFQRLFNDFFSQHSGERDRNIQYDMARIDALPSPGRPAVELRARENIIPVADQARETDGLLASAQQEDEDNADLASVTG